MVNKQLDILMEFLSKESNPDATAKSDFGGKPHVWNAAKSEDFNHQQHTLATQQQYNKAQVIDTKTQTEGTLPPASDRVYFSTVAPPKSYKGKIYVGEKGANFWIPTPAEKSKLMADFYDDTKAEALAAEDKKAKEWDDVIAPKTPAPKTPKKGSLADRILNRAKILPKTKDEITPKGLSKFHDNFSEFDLSNIDEFINSDEFRHNSDYDKLRDYFKFSVLSSHDPELRGNASFDDIHNVFKKIILGKKPSELKKQSWQLVNKGTYGWGQLASKDSACNYLRYWWGELTDSPLTYTKAQGLNPDFNGVYKDEADRTATIEKLITAIEGGKSAVLELGSIGNYPPFKSVADAKKMFQRIQLGKKWHDDFHANDYETDNNLYEMKENGYEPFSDMNKQQIKDLSLDEKKKHMRALYRETFDDMRKLSVAIFAHTHPNHKTISVWRGSKGTAAHVEVAGATPGAPLSTSSYTKKKVGELMNVDLDEFPNEGHPVNLNVASAAGATLVPRSTDAWHEGDGLLMHMKVEPRDIILPYPLGVGKGHPGENEIGILRGSAAGRPGHIWHGTSGNFNNIQLRGNGGNLSPVSGADTSGYDEDDWFHPKHASKLTSLHESLGGSNSGSIMNSKDGKQYYVKYGNKEQSVVENLSNQLYEAAGVPVNKSQLIKYQGNTAHLTPYHKTAKTMTLEEMANHDDITTGFVMDAWLGNWDVVGGHFGPSNISMIDGKAVRVDNGGALYMRAKQGKKNDSEFWDATDVVTEIDSMRGKGPQGHLPGENTTSVFGKLSDAQLKAGVDKLQKLSDSKIVGIVKESGIPDNYKDKMIHTLKKRRNAIVQQFEGGKVEKMFIEKAKNNENDDEQFPEVTSVLDEPYVILHDFDDFKYGRKEEEKEEEDEK